MNIIIYPAQWVEGAWVVNKRERSYFPTFIPPVHIVLVFTTIFKRHTHKPQQ